MLAKLRRFRPFGAPYVPLPATPLPLPVRYHIRYGAPLHLEHGFDTDESPDVVANGATRPGRDREPPRQHAPRARRSRLMRVMVIGATTPLGRALIDEL